jgi:hypothetical protein
VKVTFYRRFLICESERTDAPAGLSGPNAERGWDDSFQETGLFVHVSWQLVWVRKTTSGGVRIKTKMRVFQKIQMSDKQNHVNESKYIPWKKKVGVLTNILFDFQNKTTQNIQILFKS